MTLRIVQWTTGNVGRQSVAAVASNPGLELVGCYAWSADKVGRDVGELCGLAPLGVNATNDVEALLALRPDCVVYNPMWPSIDELVRILASGVNVVSTAAFINGRRLGPERKRLVEACERGGSSLFGTGVSPGFIELVGVWVHSPDKVGQDAGVLSGIGEIGVTATDDVDALLALRPDCVVYNPMWQSIDELVRILEAGVNVVTTAAFINGRRLGPDRERLVEACERGGSSLFGTGISPGWAELLSIVLAGICDRIDKITISEAAHTALYDSPETEKPAGFGRPIDDPDLQRMTAEGTAVFGEAVAMMADALGVELDEIVCESEHAKTAADLDLGSWRIAAGCVAGVAASWQGKLGGRTLVELNVRWKKAMVLEPDWKIADGYSIEVAGLPTIRSTLQFLPPPDFQVKQLSDFMVIGHIMTAMPAVNAIPRVVAAPPGIVSYADVAVPLPRGLVRR
jgi:hypothetical protein